MFRYLCPGIYWGEAPMPYMEFISDLPNLIDGTRMFSGVTLSKFQADENGKKINLNNLEIGEEMFYISDYMGTYKNDGRHKEEVAQALSQIDLPKLKNGTSMFALLDFGDLTYSCLLPELVDGVGMFGGDADYRCSLIRFESQLPKLTNGGWMFSGRNMREFRGTLPSLVDGYCMFSNTWYNPNKLDSLSIKCIVDSLPDRTGLTNRNDVNYDRDYIVEGYIDIEIGCSNNDEDKQLYAEEGGFTSFQDILNQFSSKNWIVSFTFMGRPSTSYSMRRTSESETFVSSIWCKLEEVKHTFEENKKNRYRYTSQDCTKHYNLHYFHETTGSTDGYIQFNSIEEAIEHFNIKPVERN